MTEELKGNGHLETLVVDDEPTEGVVGARTQPRNYAPARRSACSPS